MELLRQLSKTVPVPTPAQVYDGRAQEIGTAHLALLWKREIDGLVL